MMKPVCIFMIALLSALISLDALSHDVSKSVSPHLGDKPTQKKATQQHAIQFSYIWVNHVTDLSPSSSQSQNHRAEVNADELGKLFEFRGDDYRFIGSEIIDYQDVLTAEAHSASSLSIELTPQGGHKLTTATAENIGKQMAILINNEVVNIATVQMALGAKMVVTGLSEEQINYMLSRERD
ncbi:hypothetical protein [Shewanella sp. UCD-KL12]|uniref:SecDF P1 head subdomain-containing protein n=1 Tax=Shewanella sp. UCD-KL12 TaxID=1917163 RepID=UPI00097115C7|nr:hypothetical protein [Shewanella sp. UCD-KL12]